MTHLYIEQNGITEEVSSSVISKLYELASSGTLDGTSDLKGRLHSTVGYRNSILYLTTQYPNLHITVDDYAIPFEDSNMLLFLLDKGIGSNGMITEDQAAAVTSISAESNATITKFNELKYFTSITATGSYTTKFVDWTALEEVDVSNFTRVGGATSGDWQGSFLRCTSLKKVTASSKLTMFGHAAFTNCSNLELITGVTGAVSLGCGAFESCSKLPQRFFQPLIVTLIKTDSSGKHFYGCTLLQSINIDEGNTVIPTKCFYNCTNLTSVTIPSTLTTIEDNAFYGCTSLTSIDLSNITHVGEYSFYNCTGLHATLPQALTLINCGRAAFCNCPNLTFPSLLTISVSGSNTNNKNCLRSTFENEDLSDTDVILDSTVTTIGISAFYKSHLKSISAPYVKRITTWAFCDCDIQEINLPQLESVPIDFESNYNGIFASCLNLKKVVFGHLGLINQSTIYNPDNAMFGNCSALEYVDFGDSITTMNILTTKNSGLFAGALNVQTVIIRNTSVPKLDRQSMNDSAEITRDIVINNLGGSNIKIYVPDSAINDYKAAEYWNLVADKIYGISELPQS